MGGKKAPKVDLALKARLEAEAAERAKAAANRAAAGVKVKTAAERRQEADEAAASAERKAILRKLSADRKIIQNAAPAIEAARLAAEKSVQAEAEAARLAAEAREAARKASTRRFLAQHKYDQAWARSTNGKIAAGRKIHGVGQNANVAPVPTGGTRRKTRRNR